MQSNDRHQSFLWQFHFPKDNNKRIYLQMTKE